MMGEMERIKAIIAKKKAEKEEKEAKEAEAKKKAADLKRSREIASDPRAPEKYRAAHQEKVDKHDKAIIDKEKERLLREARKEEAKKYLEGVRKRKLENAKTLMKKYGRRE